MKKSRSYHHYFKGTSTLVNDKLIIPVKYYEKMIEHSRFNLPYEACGLLSGNKIKVQSIWELENEIRSTSRYFVGKKVVEHTLQVISKQKETVLAIYHSHPTTAPVPSYYDIVHHPDSEIFMIIVSFKMEMPKVKCYRVQSGVYNECPILIESTF